MIKNPEILKTHKIFKQNSHGNNSDILNKTAVNGLVIINLPLQDNVLQNYICFHCFH